MFVGGSWWSQAVASGCRWWLVFVDDSWWVVYVTRKVYEILSKSCVVDERVVVVNVMDAMVVVVGDMDVGVVVVCGWLWQSGRRPSANRKQK